MILFTRNRPNYRTLPHLLDSVFLIGSHTGTLVYHQQKTVRFQLRKQNTNDVRQSVTL